MVKDDLDKVNGSGANNIMAELNKHNQQPLQISEFNHKQRNSQLYAQ